MTGMTDGVRVAVTVAFLATGGFCLWRCVELARSRRLGDRIGYGAHALMSGSMVAMVWSPPRLVGWQMAIFALGCGWFVVQALGVPVASLRPLTGSAYPVAPMAHAGRGGRIRCLHHAALMAVMVWMFHALSAGSMAMPGMKTSGATGLTLVLATTGTVYAVVAAVLLAVAALAAPRRPRPGTSTGDDAVHTVMTFGMAAMLLTMA
jgi:hypothetical protein